MTVHVIANVVADIPGDWCDHLFLPGAWIASYDLRNMVSQEWTNKTGNQSSFDWF